MFGQMRSSRDQGREDDKPSPPMSRSQKIGFAVTLGILLALLGILYIDSFVLPPAVHTIETVISKEHLSASQGQTSTGFVYDVPEKWQLSFYMYEDVVNADVGSEFYDHVHVDDTLKVAYIRSRIFHRINIVLISK